MRPSRRGLRSMVFQSTRCMRCLPKAGSMLGLARCAHYGGAYMSAVTVSEPLVGVERANIAQRGAFVENLLAAIPVLEFSAPVARTHARMLAARSKNKTAGAHDALIAATAVHHGYGLLTRNVATSRHSRASRSRGLSTRHSRFARPAPAGQFAAGAEIIAARAPAPWPAAAAPPVRAAEDARLPGR